MINISHFAIPETASENIYSIFCKDEVMLRSLKEYLPVHCQAYDHQLHRPLAFDGKLEDVTFKSDYQCLQAKKGKRTNIPVQKKRKRATSTKN